MRATHAIDPIATTMCFGRSENMSEFSCSSHLTPSADSKTGQKVLTDEDLSKLDDGDGANIDKNSRYYHGLNGKQTISDSTGPTARSESAESVESDPRSKLVGDELTFEKGTHFSQSEQVARLPEDNLSAVPKNKAGDTPVLFIRGEGHIVVNALSEEQLAVAHPNSANEFVATIYRTCGNHNQRRSAEKKTAGLPDDHSSLLFHRTELIKARTLRALTGSKHIAPSGCLKREPAAIFGNVETSQSLSSLIDVAKAKIHHGLTAPEHTGRVDSSSTSSALSARTKPEKKAKKVAAAEIDALRFHRVFNHVQFCVIVLFFLIIIGLGLKGDAKKNHRIGIWLGA